jgi:hypothetical protein
MGVSDWLWGLVDELITPLIGHKPFTANVLRD